MQILKLKVIDFESDLKNYNNFTITTKKFILIVDTKS
jgi:hypothetical protein